MEADHSAGHNSQMTTSSNTTVRGVVSESVPLDTRDAEDFGILSDNKWDLVAAYERGSALIGWPFRVGGCELTRDPRGVLMKSGRTRWWMG